MQKDLSQIFRENFNISEEDLTEARRIKAEKKRVVELGVIPFYTPNFRKAITSVKVLRTATIPLRFIAGGEFCRSES